MVRKSDSEVKPRNGCFLNVGIVARISGCAKQKELSLEDQTDHGRDVAESHFNGEIEYRVIATKGKGERLDRPELAEIERLLRTGELDILIFEDVGRLVRGPAAHRLCGIAVDHGTRVLSPNDFIDTAEESWEDDVMEACREHMKHNAHTSRRLKHKLMNRFEKLGAATPCPIFGYIKPKDAKTFTDWSKDEAQSIHIQAGFEILKRSFNGEAVAEYFNAHDLPTGPYCRTKHWNGTMALRFYRNAILKGMPGRGYKHTIKHNESGRRIAVNNPKGPIHRHEPHLAFLDPAEFDAVHAELQARNLKYKRKTKNGFDPRSRVLKKRTRSFGQHARCYYCGAHYVWGGNGITDHLMCSGSREWKCWNSIGFDGPLAAKRLVKTITDSLEILDGFDAQFQEMVNQAMQGDGNALEVRRKQWQMDRFKLDKDKENLTAVILNQGDHPMLNEMLSEIDRREKLLLREGYAIDHATVKAPQLPKSTQELRELLLNELERLSINSLDIGQLIRELVPEMHVYLVRLCDGGHLLPRAKVKLNLLGSTADSALVPDLRELLSSEMTLDLFIPPERERIREQAVTLEASGKKQREIACELIPHPTQTAVFNALELDRKMKAMGLSSPFVMVDSPPEDYRKLRRHKNKKFHFEAVAGYKRPIL